MLKTACERFCKTGEADAEYRTKQNNTMTSMCLNKSLTASAKASLLTYHNEYTFDCIKYAPIMYKIMSGHYQKRSHLSNSAGQPAELRRVCSNG